MKDEPMIKFPAFGVIIGVHPAGRDFSISHAPFCRCPCKGVWLINRRQGVHTQWSFDVKRGKFDYRLGLLMSQKKEKKWRRPWGVKNQPFKLIVLPIGGDL